MGFVLKFGWAKDNMEDMPCPTPGGWKITREKVWSEGTGRTSSAKFQGKLVAKKVTLDMAFPVDLSPAKIKKITKYADPDDLANHKYCYIQFTNEKSETETKQFYFGNPSFDGYAFFNGKMIFNSISVRAVER